jgi:branched-chain amino acid transport system permease protein
MDLLLVFGFIAAVIGGLDSLIGAVVGAMILGLGISFSRSYISTEILFPTAFILLILVLIVRPGGLFAAKGKRRA